MTTQLFFKHNKSDLKFCLILFFLSCLSYSLDVRSNSAR